MKHESIGLSTAVAPVPEDRVAVFGEVEADLVGPAGAGAGSDESETAPSAEAGELGDRLLARAVGGAGVAPLEPRDLDVHRPPLFGRAPLHEGDVLLFDPAFTEEAGHPAVQTPIPAEEDDSARLLVETVVEGEIVPAGGGEEVTLGGEVEVVVGVVGGLLGGDAVLFVVGDEPPLVEEDPLRVDLVEAVRPVGGDSEGDLVTRRDRLGEAPADPAVEVDRSEVDEIADPGSGVRRPLREDLVDPPARLEIGDGESVTLRPIGTAQGPTSPSSTNRKSPALRTSMVLES